MVLPKNDQWECIDHEGIVDCFEQNHEDVEWELDAEAIFGLEIEAEHQGVHAFVDESRGEGLSHAWDFDAEEVVNEDEDFFVVLEEGVEVCELVAVVIGWSDDAICDDPVLFDDVALVEEVGAEGESHHIGMHSFVL